MKNKKSLLAVLALVGAFTLSGCDKVYARPSTSVGDQVLINGSNVSHNTVDWLYDTLHDKANTTEEIRNAILKTLSEGLFGEFSYDKDGNIIIKGYDNETDSKKLEFVISHKAYWDKIASDGSNKLNYVKPTTLTDTIVARIELYKSIVNKEVVTSLYSNANSDSYKFRNYFYEIKFARSLASKLYDITDISNIFDTKYDKENDVFTNNVLLDNTITTEDITSIIGSNNSLNKPVLHIALYSDYINKEILPKIMENLLVQQYVYDNQYTAISRTQSRKIKFVKISTESKNITSARNLITTYVNNYISKSTKDKEINLDLLAQAWKGVYSDLFDEAGSPKNEAGKLLIDSGFKIGTPSVNGYDVKMFADGSGIENHKYFENTEFGDLIEEFAKITLNPKTNDTAVESTFTSAGSYSISTGLNIQTDSIRIKDYTTADWGAKDTGFSSLPSTVKTRLYDYTVMTDFNTPTNIDDNSYIKEVNGHYFLKRDFSQSTETEDSIVIKEGNDFYIVEILEAPSQAKLTIGGENAYDNTAAGGLKQETIARSICYTIGSGSTYTTTAFTHYLEDCEIIYNDQSIYDYFVKNYPDLFNV